jgi:hypothetical protein
MLTFGQVRLTVLETPGPHARGDFHSGLRPGAECAPALRCPDG